jgi:hypothetical protein
VKDRERKTGKGGEERENIEDIEREVSEGKSG